MLSFKQFLKAIHMPSHLAIGGNRLSSSSKALQCSSLQPRVLLPFFRPVCFKSLLHVLTHVALRLTRRERVN